MAAPLLETTRPRALATFAGPAVDQRRPWLLSALRGGVPPARLAIAAPF